ncbi:MAG: redoxin domain-containing protein [Fibrobacter sp.]|nr:redoxin domain-containing protein [Fibrobacter sp.]
MSEHIASVSEIPNFSLLDTNGRAVPTEHLLGAPAILICFINKYSFHLLHIREVLGKLVREFEHRGVVSVGINSEQNELNQKKLPCYLSTTFGSSFHLLNDHDHTVAQLFHVSQTPDFFVFNKIGKLVYHGQMDESRPDNNKHVTGANLRAALETALRQAVPGDSLLRYNNDLCM